MPTPLKALAVVAGLVLAFALGTTTGPGESPRASPAEGPAERETVLRGPGGEAIARVVAVEPGRRVELRTTTLPAGAAYELWLVAPQDRPRSPRRVSAGTWRPNADGVTDVRLMTAADPAAFGRLEVTREADADPRPSADVVLASG